MAEAINCPSCGAANQLPEGKNSMFCAFCGTSIQVTSNKEKSLEDSAIKVKPKISVRTFPGEPDFYSLGAEKRKVDGGFEYWDEYSSRWNFCADETSHTLSLKSRGINSFEEIIHWFSDNELEEIDTLDLSNNNLKSFKGLEKFSGVNNLYLSNNKIESLQDFVTDWSFKELDLSNNNITSLSGIEQISVNSLKLSGNKIKVIDKIPKPEKSYNIKYSRYDEKHDIDWDFSNNSELKTISDEVITCINSYSAKIGWFKLNIEDCTQFDINILDKIRFNSIMKPDSRFPLYISIYTINGSYTPKLEKISKEKTNSNSQPSFGKILGNELSNGKCFIATATMGSYDHPLVMELRFFRDNWILKKSWGASFISWYYHYGAIAAKSIEKSFILKKICYLLIVKPVVYLSRMIKN